MALYDDLDTKSASAWSSGIKLMQQSLAVKQKQLTNVNKKVGTVLAPVLNLNTNKKTDESKKPKPAFSNKATIPGPSLPALQSTVKDYDWDIKDEYDPLWPNDYEKIMKERREKVAENIKRARDRKRPYDSSLNNRNDDEDDYQRKSSASANKVAIAPPPSLQEQSDPSGINTYGASSVAAKIMARYGFKDGQGLGKSEQGMSVALQVEKTSKRGGRILHEKDLMPPPAFATPNLTASSGLSGPQNVGIPGSITPVQARGETSEQSITEIIKSPSKVVLLRNMVGPGDVDDELEPEVKDECNTKYGDVNTVIIHELPEAPPEEAVRIFVEFRRIESAIKAVVDLNGRFFGGRQVKAGFYSFEKFQTLQLLD